MATIVEEATKQCSTCKTEKSLDSYNKDKSKKGGLCSSCRDCNKARSQAFYEANKAECDAKRRQWYEDNREHSIEKARERALADPEATAAYHRAYREANSERIKANRLSWAYGITMEQHREKYEEQGGCCALCRQPAEEFDLAVDHCHKTGVFRFLLHAKCNSALGLLGDDPTLVPYLAEFFLARMTKEA